MGRKERQLIAQLKRLVRKLKRRVRFIERNGCALRGLGTEHKHMSIALAKKFSKREPQEVRKDL